ncbi:MAG: pilus assembly PilX family protein [Panacagrimonas sp.]
MSMRCPHSSHRVAQQGMVLVICLVFLVALTLIGLAAMGSTTLQHKMAYGLSQSHAAFQSAELAVSAGETWLEARLSQPIPDCAGGCAGSAAILAAPLPEVDPDESLQNRLDSAWWDEQGRFFGARYAEGSTVEMIPGQYLDGASEQPRYVLEELGKDPSGSVVLGGPKVLTIWYYRVTGRGTGASASRAPTLVESVYAKGF